MSYISKMKQEIRKDINTCEELLKKDYVEGKDFSDLVGKYLNNSNTNINENYFNLSVQDVRKNIDENTYLGDNEKKELIQKLEESEELQKSRESKNKKWKIAKGIFKFIIDKGADIAIMFIPQILKAIQS